MASSARLLNLLMQCSLLEPARHQQAEALAQRHADPKGFVAELASRGWLTRFQAQELLHGREANLKVGGYLLLEPIGGGGSGRVYKARHLKMNRIVALKVLHPDLQSDPESSQRFLREIEAISHISHPNIVHAYEAGPMGAGLMLVMEWAQGTNLDELVQERGPLPVARVKDYLNQALLALQCIHERGLVHRDIKPANLLLTLGKTGERIKLLDLGLARFQAPSEHSPTAQLTMLGSAAVTHGTPDYMAPEQAMDFHAADIRADLYSLGCTAYFLLTGEPPFGEGSLAEKLMRHQQSEPPPLAACRADVPPELSQVVRRLMAKRLPDRFQTPAEADHALMARGLADDTATSAAQPTVLIRPRRRLLTVAAGLGAGVLLIVGLLSISGPAASPIAKTQPGSAVSSAFPIATRTRDAESGRSFRAGQGLEVGPDAALDPPELTVETWLYVNEPPSSSGTPTRWVLSRGDRQVPGQYGLVLERERAGAAMTWDKEVRAMSSSPIITAEKWHHIAMTYDGENLRFYHNGELAAERVLPQPRVRSSAPLTLGRQNDSHGATQFRGRLDDVRIYNRPLSATEIKDHFQRPTYPDPGRERGLVKALNWPNGA